MNNSVWDKLMNNKMSLISKFICVLSVLGLTACSSQNDKYVEACKAFGETCSTDSQFDAVLKKRLFSEIERRDELLTKATVKINFALRKHMKTEFLVDLNRYEAWHGSSLGNFRVDQVSKKKVYAVGVPLHSLKQKLKLFGQGDIEIRTDATPNKEFSKLLELCINFPDRLCKVHLIGEIDAVRSETDGGTRWRGWIDITRYSVQEVTKSDVSRAIYFSLEQKVYKEIWSGQSKSIGEFLKSSIDKSFASILQTKQ